MRHSTAFKNKLTFFCFAGCFSLCLQTVKAQQLPVFRDASKPINERVNDLISKLTLAEKASLLGYRSQAVPRLNIPAYNWWNEGLHGVARAGDATIFPQAIAMAATFDDGLIKQVSNVISTEARAKYNLANAKGQHQQYMGLTFWSPNINIFRDPRWGRGQETYGEDPYLTSKIGTAYVQGLQGNDPLHLKASATAKHFAVHSGPESERDRFDAVIDQKDLRETYLYAFRALVKGGVESVMSAYNRVNGVPNSTNKFLLTDVLRKEWGFNGHVVTDCGALDDVYQTHKVLPGRTEVAAAAIKAGVDLDCSSILQTDVIKAIDRKLITEKEVDNALAALLRTQIKLGFFDDPAASPFKSYGDDSIHNAAHIALARKVSQQSMVLLKNSNNILPLKKDAYPSIMVLGPNATSFDAMVGNYHGVSDKVVTFVEGITGAVDKATRVEYDLGAGNRDTTHFGGIWAAGNADVTVAVIGLNPTLEGEAGDAFLSESGGDKKDLSLPAGDIAFMRELRKSVKKPIIAVVTAGSDVDIAAIEPYADAIILAWYPGEQGGNALADLIFGTVSPSGHLPLTFYRSIKDLPPFNDYNMKGHTYRYFNGPVQYPFGFGLSYTTFNYQWQQQPQTKYTAKDTIKLSVQIANTGNTDADEVAQAYIQYPQLDRMPIKELKSFKRVSIKKGDKQTIILSIPVSDLQKWDLKKNGWKLYDGQYTVTIGSNSEDKKLSAAFYLSK
jgi:beta-glucosidase